MIRLNIHEVKTRLSTYLDRLAPGEIIILCKRNIPIAEISALPPLRTTRRPLGLDKGKFVVPPSSSTRYRPKSWPVSVVNSPGESRSIPTHSCGSPPSRESHSDAAMKCS